MDITPYVERLRTDLTAATATGGEQVRDAAERLSLALDPGLVREVWSVARRLKAGAFRDRVGRAVVDDHLPMNDGGAEERAPAVLCVPLDLGPQLSGVLCLLRREQPRRLSDLDLEIVQALAEQAALAIGAASHSSALSRLRASLSDLPAAHA